MEIHTIRLGNVFSFLVGFPGQRILIDTGHAKTTGIFESFIQKKHISPGEIKLIVLTHAHYDHAGGAASIRKLTGAPISVHRSEQPLLMKGRTTIPRGTRWKSKIMRFVARTFLTRIGKYSALKADIEIDKDLNLEPFGIAGKVIHTPGHTEGSMTVFLDSGEAFVGDNALGILGKEHFPPFANNIPAVFSTWEIYMHSGAKILYPGHGKAFSIEALRDEYPLAQKKYLRRD